MPKRDLTCLCDADALTRRHRCDDRRQGGHLQRRSIDTRSRYHFWACHSAFCLGPVDASYYQRDRPDLRRMRVGSRARWRQSVLPAFSQNFGR